MSQPTEPREGTQCAAILSYLRTHGSITPLEALNACGCMRLAARIFDLEADGWVFDSELVKEGDKMFSRYRLRVRDVDLEDAGQLAMFSVAPPNAQLR